jgi:hypothetical protein
VSFLPFALNFGETGSGGWEVVGLVEMLERDSGQSLIQWYFEPQQ